MGMFKSIRAARAKTKAEIKAAKVRAKEEVKQAAKLDRKREKLLARQERNLLKVQKKGNKYRQKHEQKMAKNILEQRRQGRLNKDKIRRYTGVARVLIPILLPLVYRLTTQIRTQLVRHNSPQPVSPAETINHDAPLKEKILQLRGAAAASALPQIQVKDIVERLDQLKEEVESIETLPANELSDKHDSISRKVDLIAAELNV